MYQFQIANLRLMIAKEYDRESLFYLLIAFERMVF
jgi:hypothetical protein